MNKISNKIIFFILGSISFLYISSYFLISFSDWDTPFYPLIGKGIFEKHILPYGYIFDHKPYLVYIFYYVWTKIEPIFLGRFTILAIVSMIFTSAIAAPFFNIKRSNLLFIFFLTSVSGHYLDGNTEVIQTPLIVLSILLIIKSFKKDKYYFSFLSGIVSGILFNINYLSSFILSPIFIYILFFERANGKIILSCISGGIISITTAYIPFVYHGEGALYTYFNMQHIFLSKYGADLSERFLSLKEEIFKIVFILPAIIIYFLNIKSFNKLLENRVLTVWIASSFIATLFSGHLYTHYLILFLFPATIIFLKVQSADKAIYYLTFIPVILTSALLMVEGIETNLSTMKKFSRIEPEKISKIVKNEKVFNIRADHSLYYLANLETFNQFLFKGQFEQFYFEKKDPYAVEDKYIYFLHQKPSYVLIPYLGCSYKQILQEAVPDKVCQWIKVNYHVVLKAYKKTMPQNRNDKYYELYEINK